MSTTALSGELGRAPNALVGVILFGPAGLAMTETHIHYPIFGSS